MTDTTAPFLHVGVLLAMAAGLLLVGFVGSVAASEHGDPWPADADVENATDEEFPYNFTFVPDDPTPGATEVTYSSISGAQEPIDGVDGYDRLDAIMLFYDEGAINCDADDAVVFGVDRGGDNPGVQTDEDWIQHVKHSEYRTDRTFVDFYDEDDFAGDPPSVRSGDMVKSQQADCYTNPEEPSWYHAVSYSSGTYDGEEEETYVRSHPFYICDCEDEEEAREELGPPPHEAEGDSSSGGESADGGDQDQAASTDDGGAADEGTGTSAAEQSDGESAGGAPDDGQSERSTGDGESGEADGDGVGVEDGSASAGAAEADDGADAGGGAETGDGTDESSGQDDERAPGATPTPGDGAGPGPVVATLALVVSTLAVRYRIS